MISERAQIVMPYHILVDQYEEERLGGKAFGSTKSGIAPFYSDKYAKIGFQVSELFDDAVLEVHHFGLDLVELRFLAGHLGSGGLDDLVVPYAENGIAMERAYREAGIPLWVEGKPGQGHHPHGPKNPARFADFIEANAR